MQNEMEDRFAGLKRTGPVAFQRGGAPLRLRFMSGWSLGRGRRKSSEGEKRNDQGQTEISGLHARPPYEAFRMVDDSERKRVGMATSGEGRGSGIGSESVVKGLGRNFESWDKKAARRSVPLKIQKSRLRRTKTALLSLFCVPIGVDWGEAIPLFRKIFERENSGDRANGYASAAIDAFGRVDVQLRLSLERRFVLARMDAVHRTDIHTRGVFCADARLGNHVSHSGSPLFGQRTGGPSRGTAQPAKIPYTMRLPEATSS